MSQATSPVRILVVEDDEDDVLLVQGVLGLPEFALTWCPSAAVARTRLRRRSFDLVLLDHGLPDTNALAFLEEVRQSRPELPVIVLTGRDDRALAVSAVKKGAANYILKDEIRQHLRPAIREVLGLGQDLTRPQPAGAGGIRFAATAERIYRVLLDTMNEGCLVTDRAGVVTLTNKALGAQTGRDADKLLGQRVLELFDAPTRARLQGLLGLDPGPRPLESWSVEGAILGADGARVPVLVSGRRLSDERGKDEACLLTFTDVSELARSRAELLQANERLLELDRLKSHFLSMVSHDLRTPIQALILAADHLLDGMAGPLVEDQRDLLKVIQRNASRLWRLVTNLLDVSRIEAGALVLERRQVDLRGLVRSQIEEIQTLTHDTEVRLRSELPEAPVEALVDPDRLAQALTNLLSNALRFARSSVRVQLGVDSAAARIEVEDDGPGIPDQELPRIFERFARIQAHGAKSGTGLGLSIARSLVEAHGGRVQAENRFEPGGIAPLGARFVLCLPLGGGS